MNGFSLGKPWATAVSSGVYLARLRLRDFRNYDRLDVDFAPGFHLFLGRNAQGKTNLLEAIYLLSTLRSFRGVGGAHLVRLGAKGYFLGATLVGAGDHELRVYWSREERKVSLDNQPVRRVSDYFGTFRAVPFCTEDLQLVKGGGTARRRYLDLLLAQSEPGYLAELQRYARAVRSRNALLRGPGDPAALESFSEQVVTLGKEVLRRRLDLLPKLRPLVQDAYRRIALDEEALGMEYRATVKNDFAVELAQARSRERIYGATLLGPHRDELVLTVNDRAIAQYGSEGQKRSLAIALRLAQAEFLSGVHGVPPVLLIDDVMGELDEHRRHAFMPLLEQANANRGQVFMTATEENWPAELSARMTRWRVEGARLAAGPRAS